MACSLPGYQCVKNTDKLSGNLKLCPSLIWKRSGQISLGTGHSTRGFGAWRMACPTKIHAATAHEWKLNPL